MTDVEPPVDDPFEDEALSELKGYRDRLKPLGVLDGLSPAQQLALADRVWLFDELHRRYEGPEGTAEYLRIMKAYRQRTPADLNRLAKKLEAVKDAWTSFKDEVAKVHERGNVHLAYVIRTRRILLPGDDLRIERV